MNPLAAIARAFFPHFCVGCGAEGAVLCGACRAKLHASIEPQFVEKPTRYLDAAVSALPYKQPLPRRLLQLFKYERVDEAGREASALFAAFARQHAAAIHRWTDGALIVPVPMHPFRVSLRGFNQADLLASAFAAALPSSEGVRLVRRALAKRFRLKRQAELDTPAQRHKNAARAIVLLRRLPQGAKVVLIDDVFTTGATLNACAAVLKAGGAGEVRAVTLLKG